MKKVKKSTAKNIPEFIALINKYETITLEEIKAEIETNKKMIDGGTSYSITKRNLTGFGSVFTCTLCNYNYNDLKLNCYCCVYDSSYGCFTNKILTSSYNKLEDAETAIEILNAYRNRAKVLRKYAKNNNIEI